MSAFATAVQKPDDFKTTDVGVIPSDWEVKPVGAMGDVRAGKALAAYGPGELRPYLRTKNVFDGRIDIDDVLQMPMTDADFTRYRLRNGDVLLNEGQSIELVGRCAMYKDEYPEPCAIQNQLVRFRAKDGVSAAFCTHLFRYCQQSGVFAKIALQTTSVAHLGVSRFQQLQLAWPSDDSERQAIAEALDDTDCQIETLELLIAKKRQVKQGTMQELLTGQRRLPGFNGLWKVKRLGDLGRCYRGVSYNPDTDLYPFDTRSSARLLRSNNVQDAALALKDIQYVDSSRVSSDQYLRRNDVLICMANGSKELVGKSGRFMTADGHHYTYGAFMGAFRPDPNKADPAFAYYLFQTELYRRHIAILLAGSSINNLTPASVEAFAIKIPTDKDEQASISAVLTSMEEEIAVLEKQLAKAALLKQAMMQDLLTGRVRLV